MNKYRKAKRDAAVLFATVKETDERGRARKVLVPGSEGKDYMVLISRGNSIQTECLLCAGSAGHIPCKGNSRHTICYHSQAAVKLAAGKGKVYWCDTEAIAERVANLKHGLIIPVTSKQSPKAKMWLVLADVMKKETVNG